MTTAIVMAKRPVTKWYLGRIQQESCGNEKIGRELTNGESTDLYMANQPPFQMTNLPKRFLC